MGNAIRFFSGAVVCLALVGCAVNRGGDGPSAVTGARAAAPGLAPQGAPACDPPEIQNDYPRPAWAKGPRPHLPEPADFHYTRSAFSKDGQYNVRTAAVVMDGYVSFYEAGGGAGWLREVTDTADAVLAERDFAHGKCDWRYYEQDEGGPAKSPRDCALSLGWQQPLNSYSRKPERFPYFFFSAMIYTPLVRLATRVARDPSLERAFGAKARYYIHELERTIEEQESRAEKGFGERFVIGTSHGVPIGYYVSPSTATRDKYVATHPGEKALSHVPVLPATLRSEDGEVTPSDMQSVIMTLMLELSRYYDAAGDETHARKYRRRVEAFVNYLHQEDLSGILTFPGPASHHTVCSGATSASRPYLLWDYAQYSPKRRRACQDIGHANLDFRFRYEAYRAGLIPREEMTKLAVTYDRLLVGDEKKGCGIAAKFIDGTGTPTKEYSIFYYHLASPFLGNLRSKVRYRVRMTGYDFFEYTSVLHLYANGDFPREALP